MNLTDIKAVRAPRNGESASDSVPVRGMARRLPADTKVRRPVLAINLNCGLKAVRCPYRVVCQNLDSRVGMQSNPKCIEYSGK
jgi:hypothetical protein